MYFNQISNLIDHRFNYVFVAKDGIVEKNFDEIKTNMLNIVKKAGLINENID